MNFERQDIHIIRTQNKSLNSRTFRARLRTILRINPLFFNKNSKYKVWISNYMF